MCTFEAASRLSCAPPRNTEEAQYNLAYPVAAVLIDGELGPRQVLPPRLFAPEILALAAKVEAVAEPRFEGEFPVQALAEIQVVTREGRSLSSGVMQAPWQPPDDVPTDTDLQHKFDWLAVPVIGAARAQRIAETVWNLESVENVHLLISECVVTG